MEFPLNKEFAFSEPTITVDPLPVGLHQFELVVENDLGRRSAAVQFSISVFGQAVPPGPLVAPARSARPKKRPSVKRVRKRKPSP